MAEKDYLNLLKHISENVTSQKSEEEKGKILNEEFEQLNERKEEFISFVKKEYEEYPQDYLDLMVWLAQTTRNQYFIHEVNTCFLNKAFQENEDYFLRLKLKVLQWFSYFRANKAKNLEEDWLHYNYLKTELQNLLEMNYKKIPLEERDPKSIVIVTSTLLTKKHAPTILTLAFAKILKKNLGYNVYLVNAAEDMDETQLLEYGVPRCCLVRKGCELSLNGNFEYHYEGEVFEGYQVIMNRENIPEMKNLMQSIYEKKPYCVWHFGGIPTFATAMEQFTTVLYTTVNMRYAAVPANIIVNYFGEANSAMRNEKEFLQEKGIVIKDITFAAECEPASGLFHKADFGIPEESFCIGVVGNRPQYDCSQDYLKILKDVIEKYEQAHLIFIGKMPEEFQAELCKILGNEEKLHFLGYQKQFEEAIELQDLFVDPLHNGGATGGTLSLRAGIPVVCVKGGDVSSYVGKDFSCDILEEYPELIQKYIEDKAFYKKQSEHAVEVYRQIIGDDEDKAKTLQGIMDAVAEREKSWKK